MSGAARRAIIVAAGRGRRLGRETDELPKCMVEVAGRPILHWQLDALAAAGADDVVIVRGYRGDRIDPGRRTVRFVDNADWESNNILASLLCARAELAGGFFFSYADIVYRAEVTRAVRAAAGAGEIVLAIDRAWRDAYEGRTLHPVAEAELALVDPGGEGGLADRVRRVGKRAVAEGSAAGEFIGLAHVGAAGARALCEVWDRALAAGGPEAPFGNAPRLRQAYLTDALNALADAGVALRPAFIDGGWREIDTEQDLARARAIFR